MEVIDTSTGDISSNELEATIKSEPRTRVRSRRACLACNKKKVRCDRDEKAGGPCSQCAKRPDLAQQCVVDDDTIPRPNKPRERKRPSEVAFGDDARDVKPKPHPPAQSPALLDGIQSASEGYNQTPQVNGSGPAYTPHTGERRITGGYSSTAHSTDVKYPAYASPYDTPRSSHGWTPANGVPARSNVVVPVAGPSSTWQDLSLLLPAPKQALRYFDVYKSMCNPVYPLLEDIDEFESEVCKYVDDMNKGRLQREVELLVGWQLEQRISGFASITAVAAMGIQYSDLPSAERVALVQDYSRRAMHLLRMSNYLMRPSAQSVTTLLLIARILEDNFEPEAARGLLSLIGFMLDRLSASAASHFRSQWAATWQDCYLSLALGAPSNLTAKSISASTTNLTYTDCMFTVSSAASNIRFGSDTDPEIVKHNINMLKSLLQMYDRALPRLSDKDQCRTIQQRVEHFTLRIQYEFVVTAICRSVWPSIKRHANTDEQVWMTELCQKSASACIQAYIELKSFSTIASRSWLLSFAALTAALILPRNEGGLQAEESRGLRHSFLSVMAESDVDEATPPQVNVHVRYTTAIQMLQRFIDFPKNEFEDSMYFFDKPKVMWNDLFADHALRNREAMGSILSQQIMFGI